MRYEAVNAMLLNEFLKEHRRVEKQRGEFEAKFAQQQKQIETLTAGVQKLSNQLELAQSAERIGKEPHSVAGAKTLVIELDMVHAFCAKMSLQ